VANFSKFSQYFSLPNPKVSEGLKQAEGLLKLATDDNLKVLLLILSDRDITKEELKASKLLLSLIKSRPEIMTLGFGKEKYWENLEKLATIFNGKFHRTPDTLTLNNVLEQKTLGKEWSVAI